MYVVITQTHTYIHTHTHSHTHRCVLGSKLSIAVILKGNGIGKQSSNLDKLFALYFMLMPKGKA